MSAKWTHTEGIFSIETHVTGEPARASSPPPHVRVDKHIDQERTAHLASGWESLLLVLVFSLGEQTLSLSHKFMSHGLEHRVPILKNAAFLLGLRLG